MDLYSRGLKFYEWTLEFADPRVADWPLIYSPFPTIAVVALYFLVIFYIGPKLMKNR